MAPSPPDVVPIPRPHADRFRSPRAESGSTSGSACLPNLPPNTSDLESPENRAAVDDNVGSAEHTAAFRQQPSFDRAGRNHLQATQERATQQTPRAQPADSQWSEDS